MTRFGHSLLGEADDEPIVKTVHGRQLHRNLREMGFYNALRPVVIGTVHGLAGSAAVAILVMTTISEPSVGGCLSAAVWAGDCGGDGCYDYGDGVSDCLYGSEDVSVESGLLR